MRRIFSVITLMFVLSFFCLNSGITANGTTNANAKETANGTAGELEIVVLGDSIARGYGLENPERQRFSAILEEKLFADHAKVKTYNYAVDGITGNQLLDSLKGEYPAELGRCDYVIISIGGNNVLGKLSKLDGFADLAGNLEPKVFIDYFRYLFAKDKSQREALDYARETLNMLFKSANDALNGDGFASLVAEAGQRLEQEIPEIAAVIREINPNAKIIIQTVYNPYKDMRLELKGIDESLDLSKWGEIAVEPLNEVIEKYSDKLSYEVAPVAEAFEASSEGLTNAGFDLLNNIFGVDPHPNKKGHAIMAEIYYDIITEEANG